MIAISASASSALSFRARPVSSEFPAGAGARLTASATLGGSVAMDYPAADVGYVTGFTASGATDDISLTLQDGAMTATVGSPTIVSSGKDFNGQTLPLVETVQAIRIRAAAANAGILRVELALVGSDYDMDLEPGQVIHLAFPAAGKAVDISSELRFTSLSSLTAGDEVTVEVIATAVPD